MNPKHINVDMNKKLIMKMYVGFVVIVGLVFGTGLYIINRQQDMIDKQQQIIEKQEQTIIHNGNTIESLKDKIDELLHKSNKQGLLEMSIINLPTIKKFHLAMRDGYTDVKYGDRLIVSVENPDLYNFRIKDTSFVYYPEPGNASKRVGYYRTNEYAIKQYTEELVDGVWKVRDEKTVIYQKTKGDLDYGT